MTTDFYRNKWSALQKYGADGRKLSELAQELALSFMDNYFRDGSYKKEYIELLCEMATLPGRGELNNAASTALFEIIIEGLCDDFEELQEQTYNMVMTQVISYCRKISPGKMLDDRLHSFGIYSEDDLFTRIENIRTDSNSHVFRNLCQKILILSRVTVGADVAITSVIVQRLARMFPRAEMVVIGSEKLEEIFGGNPDVHIRKVDYSRRGALLDRLASWHSVLQVIDQETKSHSLEHTMVVDPDSRLSQLGVMPLTSSGNYLFFNSRGNSPPLSKLSMAEITNAWLDSVFGAPDFCYPRTWLRDADLARAEQICDRLRRNGCERIIAINFGVGGNPRKRVSGDFERKLLLTLLQEPQTVVILDKGFGDEELARAADLMAAVARHGYPLKDTGFQSMDVGEMSSGLIGTECSIGEMAALISRSDLFIGYDSACQHIAASLAVPLVIVFAGSNNSRFIRRWSACGPVESKMVHVDTLTNPKNYDTGNIISRVLAAKEVLLEK